MLKLQLTEANNSNNICIVIYFKKILNKLVFLQKKNTLWNLKKLKGSQRLWEIHTG